MKPLRQLVVSGVNWFILSVEGGTFNIKIVIHKYYNEMNFSSALSPAIFQAISELLRYDTATRSSSYNHTDS